MSARFVLLLGAFVVAAVVLADVLLDPAGSERGDLVVILAAPALVAAATVPLLRRWVSRRSSVAGATLAVGLCSLGIGAVTSSAASNRMFLSSHDYRLFLVMLALSCGIALLVGHQLSHPLAADVRRLGNVASSVASGDLSVRSGITRRDEVGATARAIDAMVERLAEAESERAKLAQARQNLLSGVGHDLRTPLAAMRSAVESLQDGLAPDPERYLATLAAQIETVSGLIDQLFQYARIEAGQRADDRTRVSLAELADEAVEALSPLADRRGIRIELDANGAATVAGSPSDLSRVLRNLLDNAVRHSPPNGVVRVHVREHGGGVDVDVRDSGDGFPIGFREIAFDPFTRADAARSSNGSSGLGLAIARAIADAHGAAIELGAGPGGHVHMCFPPAATTPQQTSRNPR